MVVIDRIEGGGSREGRRVEHVPGAVNGVRGEATRGGEVAVRNHNNEAGPFEDVLDLEPYEVQVVTLWDKEARNEDIYKVAYSIFSRKRFDSPSLTVMRVWLVIFVAKLPQDFFLNGSRQIENFKLLMNACRFPTLSKKSRAKKWTCNFVADKLAILLVLRQQVMDEREERK